MAWRTYLKHPKNRSLFIVTVLALVFTLVSYGSFLTAIEKRSGVHFTDPLHTATSAIDCTWPIFVILYCTIIATIVLLRKQPDYLMRGIRAYTLLIGLRMLCMWLLPLDPPNGMIPLSDPFAHVFASGEGGAVLSRDLFFSGHTSLLVLLALIIPFRKTRWLFLSGASIVAIMLVLMRVHYTVDVVVAPMAAIISLMAVGGFVPYQQNE